MQSEHAWPRGAWPGAAMSSSTEWQKWRLSTKRRQGAALFRIQCGQASIARSGGRAAAAAGTRSTNVAKSRWSCT
eukprot:9678302-Heterocapsa_arctica.AAC.1